MLTNERVRVVVEKQIMPGWSKKIIAAIEVIVLIIIAMFYTEMARAHARFALDGEVPPRSTSAGIKTGPCGDIPRSQNPTTLTAGQQITMEWEETIDHPGSYRIAFSPANDEGFDDNVLYDAIDTQDGGNLPHRYSTTITLPNMVCETCSLQLIQTMTDRNPPTMYYSCADIRLVADVPPQDVQNLTAASGNNEVSIAWDYPDSNNLEVLVLQSTSVITASPAEGQAYQVNDIIDSSSVVYTGASSQYVATGLTVDQTYHFKVFVLDQQLRYSPGVEVQQTISDNSNDTIAPAPVQNFTATAEGDTMRLSWENPADDFYKVVIVWDTISIDTDPIANMRYNIGDEVGTSSVVFNGLGNSASIAGLSPGQTYYFKIFAHDANFNYSSGVEASEFLPADGVVNQQPELSLTLSQNGMPVTTVYQDRGPVTMTVMITDDNDPEQATISWGGTDTRLEDTDALPNTLTFDPSVLSVGSYRVQVTVADNGNPPQSATANVSIEILSAYDDDSSGAGSVGHIGLLLFLLLLQRYYSWRTRRI
ncbi:SCE4755 family polysaccharide monooxygenase-like protein [Kaarinaea lacus]